MWLLPVLPSDIIACKCYDVENLDLHENRPPQVNVAKLHNFKTWTAGLLWNNRILERVQVMSQWHYKTCRTLLKNKLCKHFKLQRRWEVYFLGWGALSMEKSLFSMLCPRALTLIHDPQSGTYIMTWVWARPRGPGLQKVSHTQITKSQRSGWL